MHRRSFTLTAAALAFCPLSALAQTSYPDRAITIVNPYPGGPTDTFARLVARKLSEKLGQSVVVDGKAGAGGVLGVSAVARARPDGYTLLVTSASTTIQQPVVRKSLPYDVEKDLIPISSTGQTYQIVVVHPSLPVSNLNELIAYARANPGKVTYGSSGLGTALHLAGEVFCSETGVKMLHVPYKTAAQAATDLLGGQIQVMFDSVPNSAPHIKAGKLRGLAIMGPTRVDAIPDLRTTTELNLPRLQYSNWLGVYAPAGTPKAVVDRITDILKSVATDADFRAFYDTAGMTPNPMFGAEMAHVSREQRRQIAEVVKAAGIALVD